MGGYNPKSGAQFLKLRSTQGFGEDVRNLVGRLTILQEYIAARMCFLNEKMSHIYVLGPPVSFWVLNKFDR
jgi:hypothetical protein